MIQTQIFYQTALKEISVTKAGTVRNNKTGKLLTVGERGYFILNQKPHNLPKLQLQTFQKIPIKSGRINFIDGDKNNYHFENIEYVSKLPQILQPTDIDLKAVLGCYFKLNENFDIRDYLQFRMYLTVILDIRCFFTENKAAPNIEVFKDYTSINYPNIRDLSKRYKISVLDARRTVYFFLNKLIEDCKNDKDLIPYLAKNS